MRTWFLALFSSKDGVVTETLCFVIVSRLLWRRSKTSKRCEGCKTFYPFSRRRNKRRPKRVSVDVTSFSLALNNRKQDPCPGSCKKLAGIYFPGITWCVTISNAVVTVKKFWKPDTERDPPIYQVRYVSIYPDFSFVKGTTPFIHRRGHCCGPPLVAMLRNGRVIIW